MAGMDENGFEVKSLDQIRQDLEAAIRLSLGEDAVLLPDTIEGQLVSVFSRIIHDMWEELANAYNAFNPLWVTGQALDNLVLLNGLYRLPAAKSSVNLRLTGINGTAVPQGSVVKHEVTGAEFLTTEDVSIPVSGSILVKAESRYDGAVEALAGTLTIIDTPVNGWEEVTNDQDAILGRLQENDAELRARRARLLVLAGQGSLDSILSGVNAVDGVQYAGVAENWTDSTDGNGLPPHSFEAIVYGGDNDAIAQAIWEKKPVGIESFGTETGDAVDIVGDTHTLYFSRPNEKLIYVRADVSFIGLAPEGAPDILASAIVAFAAGVLIPEHRFGVGDDVIYSRLYMPFNLTYQTTIVNSLEISDDGTNWVKQDIFIPYNEASAWDVSRIDITVTAI